MPPANSPVNESSHLTVPVSRSTRIHSTFRSHEQPAQPLRPSTRTPSPSSLVPALGTIGTPVPDLASTLTIQAENDVDDDNVDFLRSPYDSAADISSTPHAPSNEPNTLAQSRPAEHNRTIQRQREVMLRSMEQRQIEDQREQRRLRDLHLRQRYNSHDSWLEHMRRTATTPGSGRPAYGERPPNQQSLYDWAPAGEEGDEEEFEDILADLREQQPNTHNDILRVLARNQFDSNHEQRRLALARIPANGQSLPSQHEPSLRSAAILRSVRANRNTSARSRDVVQRYVMDRSNSNTSASEADERGIVNSGGWFRMPGAQAASGSGATGATSAVNTDQSGRPQRERDRAERLAAYRAASERADRDRDFLSAESARPHLSQRSGETMESLRRQFLEDPGSTPYKFEKSIQVLDWLRGPDANIDAQLEALDTRSRDAAAEIVAPDLAKLALGLPPPETSWLAPGMVFSGFQHAAPAHTGRHAPTILTIQQLRDLPVSGSAASGAFPSMNNLAAPGAAGSTANTSNRHVQRDKWAVRVSIHSVDYETMTLQGTMEAFDVPSSLSSSNSVSYRSGTSALRSTLATDSSGTPFASLSGAPAPPPQFQQAASNSTPAAQADPSTFSTFLEGEILDLNTHTFATHSFPASTADDAKYWRRLRPFAETTDVAMAENALDPAWLAAELQRKYVLMRWKEKCFVRETLTGRAAASSSSSSSSSGAAASGGPTAPHRGDNGRQNAGLGLLSISGFYYVSLRRSDGHVEGLYFDPASSPYQHLDLAPEGSHGCGASEFA